jgi:OFA family oxalate/formate antiporter-like MFS transporter
MLQAKRSVTMHTNKKGWIVTFAGLGVNLILGILYAWSIISADLIDKLGWTATMTQVPYMVACVVFALSMIPGGRLQDKFGPRLVLILSSILAGIGFVFSGVLLTVWGLTIFFGVVFGLAMGLGYASPTPAAVKWFDKSKRGLISGIVVSGFGLAPIYIGPLTHYLITTLGIQLTFIILGAGFFVVLMSLAWVIKNPPADWHPNAAAKKPVPEQNVAQNFHDLSWREVLKTKSFYLLWLMFFFGTFAGLLLIGQLSKIGSEQAGISTPFLLTSMYALFNFLGRILSGFISDKIGRMKTLFLLFALQVGIFAIFVWLTTPLLIILGVAVVGFTFGGMLTIFPAASGDFFGLKNFGVNYGMLITAWGAGGLIGPLLGGLVRDNTGSYLLSYIISAFLCCLGAILTFMTHNPQAKSQEEGQTGS